MWKADNMEGGADNIEYGMLTLQNLERRQYRMWKADNIKF